MTQREENKFRSYSALKSLFEANEAIVSQYLPLQNSVATFSGKHDEIGALSAVRQTGTSGVTTAKLAAKDKLATVAFEVSCCGLAYATSINNPEMAASFDYELSDIKYGSDEDTGSMSKSILKTAKENKEGLSAHMLEEEDLTELEECLSEYEALYGKQGSESSVSVANTKKTKALFRQMDALLDLTLDRQMTKIQRKHPDFVTAYFNARGIKDLGGPRSN